MWAAQFGRVDTVKLLLEKGAQVNSKDKKGNTALSLAKGSKIKSSEKKNLEKLLLKAGAVNQSS
jgi:ankyrin repeat protein